jgi:predicted nucleotidyltransferase
MADDESKQKILYTKLLEYAQAELKKHDLECTLCVLYGSHVYGTVGHNSDWDLFVIANYPTGHEKVGWTVKIDLHSEHHDPTDFRTMIDLTIRSSDLYQNLVRAGDVQAVEIMFTPQTFVLFKTDYFHEIADNIDFSSKEMKRALRKGFSAKSSWAELRARKKFADGDVHLALKSLFHSYRIIVFGCQIGTDYTITDWSAATPLWDELVFIPQGEITNLTFKSTYKRWVKTGINGKPSLMSRFKQLLPK